MPQTTSQFVYREATAESIDAIRPLWEKLNFHHAQISPRFSTALRLRTFETRKHQLLAKAQAGRLRVELVSVGSDLPSVAYCVSTVSADAVGEIDSLFVEEHLRGQGVGTELVRRAISWLDSMNVRLKVVSVMYQNNEALSFYERFGFHPRTVMLHESHDDDAV